MRAAWAAFLAVAAALAAFPAHALDAGLLQKLADQHAVIRRWMQEGTFSVHVVGEERDSDGKPKRRTESWRRVVVENGERKSIVERALEDGKDVTALERKKAEERAAKAKQRAKDPKSKARNGFVSPFQAEAQPKHFFWTLPKDATGLLHVGFRPKAARAEELLEGEAWVDEQAGQLVRIAMKPAKLPTFVGRMEIGAELDAVVAGTRLPSVLRFDGEGGVLFVKKAGGATTTFADHALPR